MTTQQQIEHCPPAGRSTDVIERPDVGGALLVDVRAGRHPSFDRLVFEFHGPVPGHLVQYVTQPGDGGTGNPVPVRGRAVVQIVLRPAAAHDGSGRPTLGDRRPDVTDFAAFRQVADAGGFEGRLHWGIGVASRTAVRVVELSNPSRVAVDVTHPEPGVGDEVLRLGSLGPAVATWQWRLGQALQRDLRVDEAFGALTAAATRDFQRAHGLTVDGSVGPRTRAAMVKVLGL